MNGATVRESLAISTSFNYEVPIEAQIPLIADAGFTHVSLGGNESHSGYLSKTKRHRLKELLQRHSLQIDTIHGPRADQPDSVAKVTAAAEAAVDLAVPVVVVHGGPFGFQETELPARLDTLLRNCSELDSVAERTEVVFALENVLPGPATDLIRQAVPRLNPLHFGFCYDSAHDQIGGPRPFDLLTEISERLVAVHLSDRIRDFVDHLIPGHGFIDWTTLVNLVRGSMFRGPLLLEVSVTHSKEKEDGNFLKLAYESGCWLHSLVSGVQ